MEKNSVLIEGTRFIFGTNFRGEVNKFNQNGARIANIIIPDVAVAQQMAEDGWNVKYLRDDEDGNPGEPHIKITLGYKGHTPPRVVMVTSNGNTELFEDTVSLLDSVDVLNVDVFLTPWVWDKDTGAIAAYVKSMYVTIEEDYLDQKYSALGRAGMDD